ncbi:hypothetical protein RchiOBHm_Chr6g0287441 [Rosa chinensis]|uniref:Uncharacterized protein n=1 Tax=Rosa chinensis TaxID=74649 RepID=A0A2P6PV26_ROSCH|nr:hypothetical protein RchiOBHm_Chr6g0287441 [Rosa chinensis]
MLQTQILLRSAPNPNSSAPQSRLTTTIQIPKSGFIRIDKQLVYKIISLLLDVNKGSETTQGGESKSREQEERWMKPVEKESQHMQREGGRPSEKTSQEPFNYKGREHERGTGSLMIYN